MLKIFISMYLFIAILITTYFSTYVISKVKSTCSKFLFSTCLLICLYLFGYLMELNSSNLEHMIFWNSIQNLGLPFVPSLWLLVVLLYTKREKPIYNPKTMFFIFLIPCITFLIRLTNSYHHLYYRSWTLRQTSDYIFLSLDKGPWYHIHNFYILSSLIIISTICLIEYKKDIYSDRLHYTFLLIASLIPYIGILLITCNFMDNVIDYSAILMPISMLLIMFSIFKYDFLEVEALARETSFEKSSDAMILLDNGFRIIDYNLAAKNLFSFKRQVSKGYTIEDVLPQDIIEVFKKETNNDFKIEINGEDNFFEINSSPINNSFERKVGVLKSMRDITQRTKDQEKLEFLASTDLLTGLNNRRIFMQHANREFEEAKLNHHTFSFLMIDIDHFKSVNDNYGHAAGDNVLKEIGAFINVYFRKTGIAGRIGGEEFAILLPNSSIEEGITIAEKLRKAVEDMEVFYNQSTIRFTISIGITSYSSNIKSIDDILKYADEALYESKHNGRNSITIKNY